MAKVSRQLISCTTTRHDASIVYPNYTPIFLFNYYSDFNENLQSQFGVQQLYPQRQYPIQASHVLQPHYEYGTPFPSNASPFPSRTIGLSGSRPRAAQAAAVDASSSSANFCGLAASLAHQEPQCRHPSANQLLNDGSRNRFCYSDELKRQFCLEGIGCPRGLTGLVPKHGTVNFVLFSGLKFSFVSIHAN
jgi:hypothetical protein